MKPYKYDEAKGLLTSIIEDIRILSGDSLTTSWARSRSWQDVAGTLATNMTVYATRLEAARVGNVVDGPAVFPSLEDLS